MLAILPYQIDYRYCLVSQDALRVMLLSVAKSDGKNCGTKRSSFMQVLKEGI